ncbi:putative bifunctional diguanylate cyclase/phosphodiesterase [Aliikangiella coralliicola]|nr:EAL domain-containing protein [Aliikangiella coralliicola]
MSSTFRDKVHSLTWRQVFHGMWVALLVGGFIYIIEVLFLVKGIREQSVRTQEQILDLAESPSAASAWMLDNRLADETLQGLLAIEMVLASEIQLRNNSNFSMKKRFGKTQLSSFESNFHRSFEDLAHSERLLHGPDVAVEMYGDDVIGKLIVTFDTHLITRNFVNQIQVSFWTSIIRSLLLAVVLGIVFNRFLTRPILQIGNALKSVNPDDPGIRQVRVPKGHDKGELFFLVERFNRMLVNLDMSRRRLLKLATRDPLTGLPNRALIYEELRANIRRARMSQSVFSIYFLDLDRFKNINDSMGHASGDQLLCLLAKALQNSLPENARVGRLGGDEFVIICELVDDNRQCTELAKSVLATVNQPVILNNVTVETSCSIGIASYPKHGNDVDSLIRHADIAMYHAKSQGVNRYSYFDPVMTEQSEARFKIETQLREAIDKQQFQLFLQPKMSAKNETVVGCEGLIRWSIDNVIISPAEFIPIAEENQMIIPIGYWVIEEACRMIASWSQQNIAIKMSVNVSPIQLQDPRFLKRVSEIVEQYSGVAHYLEFEITESSLMTNLDKVMGLFIELRKLGIKIAIDDFGTGYSSLAYLRQLELDTLKIDRSFVIDIPDDYAIPASILALASQLGLKTVAEGVETHEQLLWLAENGCDVIQGYYYSAPLPRAAFEKKYLKNRRQDHTHSMETAG